MLKDTAYDKVKLLHELSCLAWFLKNHAKPNAKKAKDAKVLKLYEGLEKQLNTQITALQKLGLE